MKILLIDIDGPLLPQRLLDGDDEPLHPVFDPVACEYINRIARLHDVRLVVSSGWRYSGFEFIERVFRENGIDPKHLHEDWQTDQFKKGGFTRSQEIQMWLDRHPEVTHWAAIDDGMMVDEIPGAVICSWEDGLESKHYKRIDELLELNHLKGE